jgi:periplasmic protein TonB
MTAYAFSQEFGHLATDSDRRFRRLLLGFGLPALILGIVIPMVDLPSFVKQVITPQRYAKLIQQAPPEKPKEEKKPEPEAKPKPELTREQKVERARKRAEKQLAALRDSLADLREANLPKVNAPLAGNVITSSTANPSFAAAAAKGSGGIGQIGVVERSGSTTGLGSRTGTSVRSGIGSGREGQGYAGEKVNKGRTLEEIQLIFDRNKGGFYTMYVREQRQNPNMVGKVIVRMTIAPDGHVKSCKVVSSELNNPEFEKKVAARVLLMDFGAKDVGDFTLDYPILFFPS